MRGKQFALVVICLTTLSHTVPAHAAAPADENAIRSAWALYTQQKYAASADAFEELLRTSTPNARLYYYAAAANRSSNRLARAKQLCDYIIANFSKSPEAAYARKLLADAAPKTASLSDGLPDSLKTKSIDELMQTEEGRKALKEALAKQNSTASANPSTVAARVSVGTNKKGAERDNKQLFTVETIASDGTDAITQFSHNPECWFECSLAAMVKLPRGQKLIAGMIRAVDGRTYAVRFPGDTVEHTITPEKMDACRVRDKALWATLIHCAQVMKFGSMYSGTIENGLWALSGQRVDKVFAANTTEQSLISFIEDAVKKQNPIVCESVEDFGPLPELIETGHAYTITEFDRASGMVTLRNPHGENSRRFRLTTDPEHKKFEQLNDGVFKIHISLFPKYISQVARAAI